MTLDGPDSGLTRQLLDFVEQTTDLVGVVDEQGRVRYLNVAARKRLGIGDATGLTTADIFPAEVFARYYDDVRPALLRTGVWHGELAVRTQSGDAIPMLLTVVANVGPGGEVNGLVTYGRELDVPAESAPFADPADTERSNPLAAELAIAVSHGLIQPHVQSVVDLHTGALVGYQGLARWKHPRRGLIEAEQFVDGVGNTPVLAVVDLAVLRRTAAAAARTARGGPQVRAYGHLSRQLLSEVDLDRYLNEIVAELRIAPSDLCVEIDHALVARPSRPVDRALRELRESGVRTVLSAIDGECEVNQMVEYGFEEIRLARRLVRDAAADATRRRVLHATIAVARSLRLTTIAVGIETDAERIQMHDAGCEYGQGDLFGPVRAAGTID